MDPQPKIFYWIVMLMGAALVAKGVIEGLVMRSFVINGNMHSARYGGWLAVAFGSVCILGGLGVMAYSASKLRKR